MTNLRVRLECEACHRGFEVTYDPSVPTKLISIECSCGHSTPIKAFPAEPSGEYVPDAADGVPIERGATHIDAFLAMALPRIAELMKADPEDATPEGRELMLLAELADRYERQKYPEFSGRPVKPHRSGGGGPPAPEPPIEVLPRHPNRGGDRD